MSQPLPPSFHPKPLSAQQAGLFRNALQRWQKLEPDNAAPKALLAWVDFGENLDSAGLAQLKAAAYAPQVNYHTGAQKEAQICALKAGGLTNFEALCTLANLYRGELAEARAIAYIARNKGYEAQAEGKNQEAVEIWQNIIRFGRLLEYKGKTAIECQNGIVVQAIGASPVYKGSGRKRAMQLGLKPAYPLIGETGRYQGGDIFEGKDHDYFLKYAGAAATADVLAGLEQGHESILLYRQLTETADAEPARAIFLLKPGFLMLIEVGLLLVLVGLIGLLTRGKNEKSVSLHYFWMILFSLLALLPTLIYTLKETAQSPSDLIFNLRHLNPTGLHFTPLLILPFCGLLTGWWTGREGKPAPLFWPNFAGVIRQTLPICLLLLVLSHAFLTAQTARVIKHIEITTTQGELAQMKREHPELFQPLVGEIKPTR